MAHAILPWVRTKLPVLSCGSSPDAKDSAVLLLPGRVASGLRLYADWPLIEREEARRKKKDNAETQRALRFAETAAIAERVPRACVIVGAQAEIPVPPKRERAMPAATPNLRCGSGGGGGACRWQRR